MEMLFSRTNNDVTLESIYNESLGKNISINATVINFENAGAYVTLFANTRKLFILEEKNIVIAIKAMLRHSSKFILINVEGIDKMELLKRNFDCLYVISIPVTKNLMDYQVMLKNENIYFNQERVQAIEDIGVQCMFSAEPVSKDKKRYKAKALPPIRQNIFSSNATLGRRSPNPEVQFNATLQNATDDRLNNDLLLEQALGDTNNDETLIQIPEPFEEEVDEVTDLPGFFLRNPIMPDEIAPPRITINQNGTATINNTITL